MGILVWLLFGTGAPAGAQEAARPSSRHISAGVAASFLTSFVSNGGRGGSWGWDVGARLGRPDGAQFELGYTYVPENGTTSPRLRAPRAFVVASKRAESEANWVLTGGVGVAALTLSSQRIDCGDFPLCNEWQPQSGTRIAPGAAFGAAVTLWDRLDGLVDVHLLRPLGESWSPEGDPTLIAQFNLGLAIRLGGGDGP